MTKRQTLSIFALILGSVLLSVAIFSPVRAEETPSAKPAIWLQVSPTSSSVALNPGDEYSGEFTVSNIGSEDFVFKVYASPFSVVGENYEHDYLSAKSYNQIHRWITIEQSDFSLPIEGSQIVKYRVSVPQNAPGGSQHAVLFAESGGNASSSGGSGIKAVSRVGMRLSARIAGQTHEAVEITQFDLPTLHISFGGSQITATSKIKNSGNTDCGVRYHFEVKPFFGGDSVFSPDDKSNLIYPESEYKHSITWENTPRLGLFSVNYSVSADDIVKDETRIVLVVPAWLLIIVFMLLTFLGLWIILKVKKRRRLRSRMQF